MSKKFQVEILKPCHESWDKMRPVEQGRFCNSCQKTVVDFTGMSDAQLIAFFKKPSAGSTCGRFNNDQLDRELAVPGKRMPWLRYVLQATIPIFLAGSKLYSQGSPVLREKSTPAICTKPQQDRPIVMGRSLPAFNKDIIGKVVDEKGAGVAYASVLIKETNYGIACDSAGNFYLQLSNEKKKITLMVSCIGYSSIEKEIHTRKDRNIEIRVTTNTSLSGEVVVTSSIDRRMGAVVGGMSIVKKKSHLQKFKQVFVRDSLRIYPNPVRTGNEIKIEWRKKEKGEFVIELYNLQGQLMESQTTSVEAEGHFVFNVPAITPGGYLLRLTNRTSCRSHVEKVIIQ